MNGSRSSTPSRRSECTSAGLLRHLSWPSNNGFARAVKKESIVLWEEGEECDLWRLDRSGIARWHHLSKAAKDRRLAMRLFATQTTDVNRWIAINCSPTTLEQLEQVPGIDVQPIETKSQSDYLNEAATRLIRSSDEAWFDLRDGSIAGQDRYRALSGWAQIAAGTIAACMLLTFGLSLWKSSQANRQLDEIEELQSQLYHAAIPGDTVPRLITASLQAAHSKLLNETDGNGELDAPPSALQVLHAFLAAIRTVDPNSGQPIRVETGKLTIASGKLENVELLFESEQDAKQVHQRLDAVGFEMGPFGIERNANGKIVFRFTSRFSPPLVPTPLMYPAYVRSLENISPSILLLVGLVLGGLFIANLWSIQTMWASQQAVEEATAKLAANRKLALEIVQFRNRPRIASREQETKTGLSDSIAEAMQAAGIAPPQKT